MIRIISDSSTMYSITEGEEKNIDISPLSVTINNKTYREYEDIHTEEFIELINKGYIPLSSQPSIGAVMDLYNKYPNDVVINISMADGLSGTYNSACTAKTMVDNPERIEVLNSRTLCGPQRYLVDVAAKLSKLDKSKEEILEVLNSMMNTSKSYLIPNDFEFLVRGGRLSPLVGRIGSAIKLVPVMKLSEDGRELTKFTTKRTYSKAIDKICEDLINEGIDHNYKISISHACKEELANTAKDIILGYVKDADIEIMKLGPAFTTQGGPGCVAIQVIKKHEIV
ncbi:DegV family protein [Clostridium paraputrificum]|uniref:DegV family protein n=1 Tax=Clostridium TaxID=1485 RepID=UPI003D353663